MGRQQRPRVAPHLTTLRNRWCCCRRGRGCVRAARTATSHNRRNSSGCALNSARGMSQQQQQRQQRRWKTVVEDLVSMAWASARPDGEASHVGRDGGRGSRPRWQERATRRDPNEPIRGHAAHALSNKSMPLGRILASPFGRLQQHSPHRLCRRCQERFPFFSVIETLRRCLPARAFWRNHGSRQRFLCPLRCLLIMLLAQRCRLSTCFCSR